MNLGRYEVVRELGKGAMGLVYLAKDPLIGRLVALKTIRAVPTSDDEESREYQQRFVREAQAAGILSHPAIVTVHDIGQDEANGTSFIAMEYVEGPTLKELIQQGKRLPYEELAEVIAQVAEALDYAHSKGIIHRDVKPANILLPGDARAKITDFGIAKIATAVSNLTTTGQFIGTPNYMAPEQVKGTTVDGRSDIFSLGIVLYECLSGRKPFGGDSLTTISYKIVHDTFTPLSEIDPQIPALFDTVVQKCLAKEPADRYQRGKELAAALRSVHRSNATQPGPAEKMLTDQTLLDGKPAPTVEVPFPDAAGAIPGTAGPLDDALAADEFAAMEATPRVPRSAAPRKPVEWRKLLTTLLTLRLPHPVFFGVIVLALAIFGGYAWNIRSQYVEEPAVDVGREQLVRKQRQLRVEGAEFVRTGNVEGAYRKYKALQELAPGSPFVKTVVDRLEQIRTQHVVGQQKLLDAQAKFNEAKALYDKKDYAGALSLFEEAFYLNPNDEQTSAFLRLTREQLTLKQQRAVTKPQIDRLPAPKRTKIGEAVSQVTAPTSALITMVKPTVTDGTVVVKIDGSAIVSENLWEERKGVIRRRVARNVHAYREIRPVSAEVEVLVSVPSLRINERRVYRHTFRSKVAHQLVVTIDPKTRSAQILLQ